MLPPPNQNTVAVCNNITFLILYYIISRLVTLLKVTDAPIQVSEIIRPSAHEQFFATVVKQSQRPIISWLCAQTAKETHILTFYS
jgi:hypothetical protein